MRKFLLTFSVTLLLLAMATPVAAENITFADPNVKAICIANWDTDGDGELSMEEAAAVTDLGTVFRRKSRITSFDELQYFTGLSSISTETFYNCSSLASITIPSSVTTIGTNAFYYCYGLTSITIPSSVTSIDDYAFYNCIGLTSITILSGVTTIGSYTFYGCYGLTSITIPSSVTSIGDNAFSGCSKLTSIDIPNGVTEIGSFTFYRCSALTTVTIPSSVTSIGSHAFYDCDDLTSVTIPSGVTTIGSYAFYDCGLTSITIPSSVTEIGNFAFTNCSKIATIFAENETPATIYSSTFTNYNVTLFVPEGSKTVYQTANYWKQFKIIVENKNIAFADAIVKALCVANWDTNGDGELSMAEAAAVSDLGTAFSGNTTITSFDELKYFTGLTEIGASARLSLHDVPFWAHTTGWGLDAPKTNLTTPTWIIGESTGQPYGDASVNAFADLSEYDQLVITYSAGSPRVLFNRDVEEGSWNEDESQSHLIDNTKGGWSAKYFTTSGNTLTVDLKQIVADKGYAHLHAIKGANWGNVTIESMTLDSSTATAGSEVTADMAKGFYGCTALESVTIPTNVTSLGDYAFSSCSSLTSVTVRWTKPVTITEQCFTNRASATLNVPAGSAEAYSAADYWKEFGSIVADNNIVFADDKVRELCVTAWDTDGDGGLSKAEAAAVTDINPMFRATKITSFNELQYFTGLTTIGSGAFQKCSNLTSVIIPKNVSTIVENPFWGCSSLAYITVEIGNADYDSRENCNAIIHTADNTLITGCMTTVIPSSIASIGDEAFMGCRSLTSVTIPSSVTSIGNSAFNNCDGLTSVTIPSSVTSIGKSAFSYCDGLTSVTISSGVTTIDNETFSNCNSLLSITIPNSVTTISYCAFYNCSSLTSITIPSNVTTIGTSALEGCSSLTSITIPNSVTTIGNYAFYSCKNLTKVIVENPTPVTITSSVFSNRTNATLFVPEGCKEAYQAADYWKEFAYIEEPVIKKQWDFTQGLSTETIANLNADADNWESNGTDVENNTNNWKNVTNQGNYGYWKANGEIIEELYGLKFDIGSYTSNSIHLATTKLRLAHANTVITFPRLKNGQTITIKGKSANKTATDRGLEPVQDYLQFQAGESSPQTDGKCMFLGQDVEGSEGDYTFVWKVVTESTDDVDVQFLLTGGGVDFKYFMIDNGDESDCILGDVNGNGGVDIGDAVSIVNYLVGKESTNFVEKAADTNKNGDIDIGDAVTIVNFLVGKTTSLSRIIDNVWDEREPQ